MAAYNTLDNTGLGFMRLQAQEPGHEGPHCLRLFESGGQRFLVLDLYGNNPGGCKQTLTLPLSRSDAEQLLRGADDLLTRIRNG